MTTTKPELVNAVPVKTKNRGSSPPNQDHQKGHLGKRQEKDHYATSESFSSGRSSHDPSDELPDMDNHTFSKAMLSRFKHMMLEYDNGEVEKKVLTGLKRLSLVFKDH